MPHRHTALGVADVPTSIAFYEDLLDVEVLREMEDSEGTRNVYLGTPDQPGDDDADLQLVDRDGPVDPGDFDHVAFTVEDVDGAVTDLPDAAVTDGPRTLEEIGLRIVFVADPDGYGVELIEEL